MISLWKGGKRNTTWKGILLQLFSHDEWTTRGIREEGFRIVAYAYDVVILVRGIFWFSRWRRDAICTRDCPGVGEKVWA